MTAGTSEDRHEPPEHVGPYRLVERLGTGGMGEVYRAYDRRLERWVAVKQVLPGESEDADAREWLRREAQAVARLNHPAVIRIHDIVETPSGDWIVMELVEGRTLRELIDDGPLELARALPLAQEISEGLAAAHAKGIVHRDLKTENVMVTSTGHAKILDFGVATWLEPGQSDSSDSSQSAVYGTSRVMSPEQINGQPVDHRSDLFSLGILLFEAVTGQSPFLESSFLETLLRIQNYQQPSARELNRKVPEELAHLIDHLLEKDPDHRPQSAEEVVAALRSITGTTGRSSPAAGMPIGKRPGSQARSPGELTVTQVAPVMALRSLASRTHRSRRASSRAPLRSAADHDSQSTGIFIKTLLGISLGDGQGREQRLEDDGGDQVLRYHDRLMRGLLRKFHGLAIAREESSLILFDRPIDAVGFMMAYQGRLPELSEKFGIELRARAGIHLGEVFLRENPHAKVVLGAKPLEVKGAAKLIAERVTSLAGEGQILLTQEAYDLSRRTMVKNRISGRKLRGMPVGRYRFRGVEESVRIFDVRPETCAMPSPPPDTEDAHRVPEERPPSPRFREGILAAFAVLAVVGYGLWFLFFRPTPRPSVAVLGFENRGGQVEEAWLSTALAEMFSSELAVSQELRLISGESVARMKLEFSLPDTDALDEDTLSRVRRNLGTDYVVVGSYEVSAQDGEDLMIDLVLRLQKTEHEKGEQAFMVEKRGSLFKIVSAAATTLREELGVGELSEADAEAVLAAMSENREATRLYSEGLAKLRNFDALEAQDLLERSVRADPDYALAHAALSEAWQALGYDRKAEASAAKAHKLAEEQKLARWQVLLIEGRYHEAATKWQEAVRVYKVLWGVFPDNVEYGLRFVEAQIAAGRGRDALNTVELLRKLPAADDDPRIDLAAATAAASLSDYQLELKATARAVEKGQAQGASILVAEALQRRGWVLRQLGRLAEAVEALEDAKRRFHETGDKGREAQVLYYLARVLENQGNTADAERLYLQALRIHQETGNRKAIARTQGSLGLLVQEKGDLATAEEIFKETVKYAREIGDRRREAGYLGTLAVVNVEQGRLADAEEPAQQNLALCEEIGFREGEGWGYIVLGMSAIAAGKLRVARARYEEALVIGTEIGHRRQSGYALHFLAEVFLAAGDLQGAMQRADEALAIRSELGERGELAQTELTRARILLELERRSEAEDLVRKAIREFRQRGIRDLDSSAAEVLARVLLAQGKLKEAGAVLAPAEKYADAGSQKPAFRLSVAITAARLEAASGEYEAALLRLGGVVGKATELGLGGLEMEALLAQGEIELASGVAGSRARLQALAQEAEEKGFGLIARKAAAASRSG